MSSQRTTRGRHRAAPTPAVPLSKVLARPSPTGTPNPRGRHRAAEPVGRTGRSGWRGGAVVGTLSVATVVAVLQAPATDSGDSSAEAAMQASPAPHMSEAEYAEVTRVTKSLDAIAHREKVAKVRAAALQVSRTAAAERATRSAQRDARPVGARLAATRYGWTGGQFSCLDQLWTRESNWHYYADNPSSSAYGIAQALPGAKMSSAGPDWATNPVTQIIWGLGYIRSSYGTPCGAWEHETSAGWY